MIDVEAIRLLLRTRLLSVEGVTEDLLACENVAFTPSPDVPDFRERFACDANPAVANGVEEASGRYEVLVFAPRDTGTEEQGRMVVRIGNAFPPNVALTGPETVSIIEREPIPGGLGDDARWACGIRVYWRAYHFFAEN